MFKVRHVDKKFPAFALLVVALWALVWVDVRAQDGGPSKDATLKTETYIKPPKTILDAVTAARPEDNFNYTNLSPDGKKFLLTKNDGMPSADRMGRPHFSLDDGKGTLTLDYTANRSNALYVRSHSGYDLFFYGDKRTLPVEIPANTRVSNPAWSPDGSQLAFFLHTLDSTHIYVADTTTGKSRKVTQTPVLATLVTTFQWSKDGKQIQTVLMPDDGTRTNKYEVATGPKVRVNLDGKAPSRTIRYLLESPADMKLLEHLSTGQLAFVDVGTGKVTKIGSPTMLRTVSMSPGGEQFRVTMMKKPFSYYVPMGNFGSQEGIWNTEGKNLYTLAEKGLREGKQQFAGNDPAPAGKGQGKKGGKGGKGGNQPPPVAPPVDPDNPQPDEQPVDPDAKRVLGWRPDGVGMSYLQLEPAKKDSKDVRKDRVMQWVAPYGKDDHKVVYETPHRIATVAYSDDCKLLFLTLAADTQRQIVAVDLADPKQTVYVIQKGGGAEGEGEGDIDNPFTDVRDEFSEDVYGDGHEQQKKGQGKGGPGGGKGGGGPGLMVHTHRGEGSVVRISSTGDVYIAGTDRTGGGAFPKPFIDKINIKAGEKSKTRIFTGKTDVMETIDAVDGDDIKIVFTTRQKKTMVPDSYMNDLTTGQSVKLTDNVDNNQWFHEIKVDRFQVTRADGIKFWVKVTTAPNAKGKQPAMFWIYPKEYTDQANYNAKAGGKGGGGGGGGKGGDGKYTAPAPRAMAMLTLLGYAVVEPDLPIIGPAGRMNDNYVQDLRNGLWATIDDLDKKGIIDRDRLAVGGHSYGAFSTANALAHTPFFKAGIAGDGCYNRTLTPMSFQTEKRHLWEARETYLEMSPLLWADRINGALLMYHGMEDANVGTNPINSEFLYMCLRGLGKPVSLYMYPYEAHGPIGRETNLDMWARWCAWLDMYVMEPKKAK